MKLFTPTTLMVFFTFTMNATPLDVTGISDFDHASEYCMGNFL